MRSNKRLWRLVTVLCMVVSVLVFTATVGLAASGDGPFNSFTHGGGDKVGSYVNISFNTDKMGYSSSVTCLLQVNDAKGNSIQTKPIDLGRIQFDGTKISKSELGPLTKEGKLYIKLIATGVPGYPSKTYGPYTVKSNNTSNNTNSNRSNERELPQPQQQGNSNNTSTNNTSNNNKTGTANPNVDCFDGESFYLRLNDGDEIIKEKKGTPINEGDKIKGAILLNHKEKYSYAILDQDGNYVYQPKGLKTGTTVAIEHSKLVIPDDLKKDGRKVTSLVFKFWCDKHQNAEYSDPIPFKQKEDTSTQSTKVIKNKESKMKITKADFDSEIRTGEECKPYIEVDNPNKEEFNVKYSIMLYANGGSIYYDNGEYFAKQKYEKLDLKPNAEDKKVYLEPFKIDPGITSVKVYFQLIDNADREIGSKKITKSTKVLDAINKKMKITKAEFEGEIKTGQECKPYIEIENPSKQAFNVQYSIMVYKDSKAQYYINGKYYDKQDYVKLSKKPSASDTKIYIDSFKIDSDVKAVKVYFQLFDIIRNKKQDSDYTKKVEVNGTSTQSSNGNSSSASSKYVSSQPNFDHSYSDTFDLSSFYIRVGGTMYQEKSDPIIRSNDRIQAGILVNKADTYTWTIQDQNGKNLIEGVNNTVNLNKEGVIKIDKYLKDITSDPKVEGIKIKFYCWNSHQEITRVYPVAVTNSSSTQSTASNSKAKMKIKKVGFDGEIKTNELCKTYIEIDNPNKQEFNVDYSIKLYRESKYDFYANGKTVSSKQYVKLTQPRIIGTKIYIDSFKIEKGITDVNIDFRLLSTDGKVIDTEQTIKAKVKNASSQTNSGSSTASNKYTGSKPKFNKQYSDTFDISSADIRVNGTPYAQKSDPYIHEGDTISAAIIVNMEDSYAWAIQDQNGSTIASKNNIAIHKGGTFRFTKKLDKIPSGTQGIKIKFYCYNSRDAISGIYPVAQ